METINYECYVSFEIAKLLKKAGFNWKTRYHYPNINSLEDNDKGYREECPFYEDFNNNNSCSCPTLDVAQRWLREVKAIHICVKPNEASANCKYFATVIISDTKWGNIQDDNRKTIMFDTYEEAQESGIKEALEIVLEKGE